MKSVADSKKNSAKAKSPPKKRRAQVRNKIRDLPPDIKRELDEKLERGDFKGYRRLSKWLEEKGCEISPTSLNYYKRKFDQRLEAVKAALLEGAEIARNSDGDDGLARALATLTQTLLFEMLVLKQDLRLKFEASERAHQLGRQRLQNRTAKERAEQAEEANAEIIVPADPDSVPEPVSKYPTKADFEAMHTVTRTLAVLGKVRKDLGEWAERKKARVEQQVEAAREKVSEAAREGGLSPDAEARIRAALLDIRA